MSNNILKSPPPISWTRNQLCFELQSTDYIATPGQEAFFDLTPGQARLLTDDSFRILFEDPVSGLPLNLVYIARTNPSQQGEVSDVAGTAAISDIEYCFLLATQVHRRQELASLYDWEVMTPAGQDPFVRWTAKDYHDNLMTQVNDSLVNSPTFSFFVEGNVSAPVYLPNFVLEVELYVEDVWNSGLYVVAGQFEEVPDEQGKTTLDLQSVMHNRTRPLDYLPPDIPHIIYYPTLQRRYYIRIRSRYQGAGLETVWSQWTYGDILVARYGGRPKAEFATGDFFQQYLSNPSWLTNLPGGTLVGKDQPFYLSLVNPTGQSRTGTVSYIAMQSDNVVQSGTVTNYSLGPWETAVIPCGPGQITGFPPAFVVHYDVVASINNRIMSLRLKVDQAYHLCVEDLFYLNSYGATETMRTTGRWEIGMEAKWTEYERILPCVYDPQEGQLLQHSHEAQHTYMVRSGYFGNDEIGELALALRDLRLTAYLFWLRDGVFVRCKLDDKKIKVHKCGSLLNAWKLKMRASLKEKSI